MELPCGRDAYAEEVAFLALGGNFLEFEGQKCTMPEGTRCPQVPRGASGGAPWRVPGLLENGSFLGCILGCLLD